MGDTMSRRNNSPTLTSTQELESTRAKFPQLSVSDTDPLCPAGYVQSSPVFRADPLKSVKTNCQTPPVKIIWKASRPPCGRKVAAPSMNALSPESIPTFTDKKLCYKQQVLVNDTNGVFKHAIVVDFDQGDQVVVTGQHFGSELHKVSLNQVEPLEDFCVPEHELPNTTKHSMKAITTQQAKAEISKYRHGNQQGNNKFNAFLDHQLAQQGVVHYGQIKAPNDRDHVRYIIGQKGSNFVELTKTYKLLFVWYDRKSSMFRVWGRDQEKVKISLRQLLFHKLKCKCEDENHLRQLIHAAETRYAPVYNFPRCHTHVSSDF